MATITDSHERRELLERMVIAQPGRLARKMRAAGHEGAEAEDLAQEALVRALTAIEGLRGPAEEALICGWVDRIATNLSRNVRRDLARRPRTGPWQDEDATSGPVSEDDADLIACRRSLEALLSGLPDEQRVVFIARVLEERTTVEVAAELGVSDDLVRWRLRTARRRLRDSLDALR
jgi:RNA polymerase sigma-70 factor (ECF subfamily)